MVGSLDWFQSQSPSTTVQQEPSSSFRVVWAAKRFSYSSRLGCVGGSRHPHCFSREGAIRLTLKASRRLFRMIADCDFASLKARADQATFVLGQIKYRRVEFTTRQHGRITPPTDRYQDADMEPGNHVESIVARQQERDHARPCCCRFLVFIK